MINLYCDGGVINRNPSDIGGTWAYCFTDGCDGLLQHASGLLTVEENGMPVTNNVTELYALVRGLERAPMGWRGTVYSDSRVSLLRVFSAGALNNVPVWLVERLQAIQKSGKLRHVKYVLLDGHPTKTQLAAGIGKRGNRVSRWNVWCDDACTKAGRRYLLERKEREVLA